MDIPPLDSKQKKSEEGVGPLMGIIIIVALVVVAGIYFIYMQEMERRAAPTESQANSL